MIDELVFLWWEEKNCLCDLNSTKVKYVAEKSDRKLMKSVQEIVWKRNVRFIYIA